MCGIVGILNLTQSPPVAPEAIRRMLGMLRHRGPDQYGVYICQDERSSVGLGSARLSIIDLSGGQQPISNEDGTVWIVFNGEIFNYVELRPEIEKLGHRMATDSDTEVIVHLYEEYGPACVEHLNGQFVFAIWDERDGSLFIARDRLGIRPLYFTEQQGALFFASEMKALLAEGRIRAELDPVTLDQIFTYWSPVPPRTPLVGVRTLPPGHWLRARAGAVEVAPYWQPTFPVHDSRAAYPSLDEAAAELRRLLVDATQIRLRADVPVGAYLSGGLDSSTITALIHHYTGNRLETFSIAFTDDAYDESSFQLQMSRHLGTHHHMVTATHADIGRVFPDVIWHTETPIMRTSPAPLYLLSRLVHDPQFKVVLTGEGADEFLLGYNIFKEAKIRRFWARQPESTARPRLLSRLYDYVGSLSQGNIAYLEKFFGHRLSDVDAPDYSHAIRWRNNARTRRVFSPALQAQLTGRPDRPIDALSLPADFGRWHPQSRAQYLEITLFLAEYLLSSQGDRVAMAHSVEGRVPFLDHRVVAFCNGLPPHYKLRGLDEKHILKRAMRDLLPEAIWHRPKRPYRAPIHRSFLPDGRPLPWVADVLSPPSLAASGLFDVAAVDSLLRKIERFGQLGETDDMTLAGLLSSQLVHRQFVADFHPAPPITAGEDLKEIIRTGQPTVTH